ncbi:MAG TPA: type 4a pilus biogenesis protein PilO [Candidatus Saccharimonadales bacterium]|nr:type 4a pilus biogenesis protein PilO [Candidatus Saccharimonadales bacterium]
MKLFIKNILFYFYVGDYSLIYFIIFMFSFVLFGFFGVRSGVIFAIEKNDVLTQLIALNDDLQAKDSQMITVAETLRTAAQYVRRLDAAIPDKSSMEVFLADFAVLAGNSGFGIQRFSTTQSTKDSVIVNIDLFGDSVLLPQFLTNLKQLNRLVTITKVDTVQKDRISTTRLVLTLYFKEIPES